MVCGHPTGGLERKAACKAQIVDVNRLPPYVCDDVNLATQRAAGSYCRGPARLDFAFE